MPNIRDTKSISRAEVYKKGEKVASLERLDGATVFSYLPGYSGAPVSFTLPVGKSPVTTFAGALPPFFSGLLPEGHRLTVLQREVKTSLDDEFSLLLTIGKDLPGDVQVLPQGTEPSSVDIPYMSKKWSEIDFHNLVHTVDFQGIAGVQEKASAHMITLPVAGHNHWGILKISPVSYPYLVENEAAHLLAAKKLKVEVSQSQLLKDSRGTSGLYIERFDRLIKQNNLHRQALEDASQLLGIYPAQKYSPTTEQVILALAERTKAPLLAKRNLYLQFLYAWLTGNGDLHAKNVSIVENLRGDFEIAPIYDVPCTLVYGDDSMALELAGRTKRLRRKHWLELADSIGIPEKAVPGLWKLALKAATAVDWDSLNFEGSVRYGVDREVRFRRYELE